MINNIGNFILNFIRKLRLVFDKKRKSNKIHTSFKNKSSDLALIIYVKPQLDLIPYEISPATLTEIHHNQNILLSISNSMLSYFKLLIQRLHSKIFSQEFTNKLTLFIYNKIKKRIDRFILVHFWLPYLKPWLDFIWVAISPYFDYIALCYDYPIIVVIISFVLSLTSLELQPIIYFNNRIPGERFTVKENNGRSSAKRNYEKIMMNKDYHKSEYHDFSFKRNEISEKCSDVDQLLAEHSNNPEANKVEISALFIKPDNIGGWYSLSRGFDKLTEGSQISVEAQKQRLLDVVGNENLSQEIKSKYIQDVCDDIIDTKVKCDQALNHIREKRSACIQEMDEELEISNTKKKQKLTIKKYKNVYDIYGVEGESVSKKIITSTEANSDNDNGEGPSRRSRSRSPNLYPDGTVKGKSNSN